jgi:hypothetical protein
LPKPKPVDVVIEERIQKSESALKSSDNVPADKKAELLGLLSKLKPAIAKVSETHREDAQSIAHFVEASTHEAIRTKKRPELLQTVLLGLKQSVEGFEASHPELVIFANQFATVLAAMGL